MVNTLERCQTVLVELPESSIVYDWFTALHAFYNPIHTYLSIAICILGTLCNFCNIIVLTRQVLRRMRTPVNMILTAMAACDTVVLFSNLVYATHYTFVAFVNCHPKHWSYGWAVFLICHAHLSLIGHSSSVWLSVMLALIRYSTLRSRRKVNVSQINLKHSYMAIASVILFVAVMNSPNFLVYHIFEMKLSETCNVTDTRNINASAYIPGVSDLALEAHCLVFRSAFWISGTIFKMVPCLLLSLFVWLLMKILTKIQRNRLKLMHMSIPNYNGETDQNIDNQSSKRNSTHFQSTNTTPCTKGSAGITSRTDRTTRMLLTILFVFLITELPQGIMAVLSGILPEAFRRYIYNSLGDLLDLLSLCNACTTFIIYCSMSEQFRNEFKRVFSLRIRIKFGRTSKSTQNLKALPIHSFITASCDHTFQIKRKILNETTENISPVIPNTSKRSLPTNSQNIDFEENDKLDLDTETIADSDDSRFIPLIDKKDRKLGFSVTICSNPRDESKPNL